MPRCSHRCRPLKDTEGALQQEAKHAKQAAARAQGGAGGAALAAPPPPPPPRREVLLYDLVRMQSRAQSTFT